MNANAFPWAVVVLEARLRSYVSRKVPVAKKFAAFRTRPAAGTSAPPIGARALSACSRAGCADPRSARMMPQMLN